MEWRAELPKDERSRVWFWFPHEDDEPYKAAATAIGVAYPAVRANMFRPGYAVLVAGRHGGGLPGLLDEYRVVDFVFADSTRELAQAVADWAVKAAFGDSEWERPALCAITKPLEQWNELLEHAPMMERRFFIDEWSDQDMSLRALRERYGRPPLELGAYEYERTDNARYALAYAVMDLDAVWLTHGGKGTPKEEEPEKPVDRGRTGY